MPTKKNTKALQRWSEAKRWVLHHGKKTSTEYIYVYDAATGSVLSTGGNGLPGKVQLPDAVISRAGDRTAQLGVHHNHPNSSALTPADLTILAKYPGMKVIVAHGHDGSDYVVMAKEHGNIQKQVICLDDELRRILRADPMASRLHAQGRLTPLLGHLLCSALVRSGVIAYRAYLTDELVLLYQVLKPDIDSWVAAAVISCPIVRKP